MHQACYTRINAHSLLLLSPRTSSTSSSSSSSSSSLSSSSSSSKSCCLLKRRRNPTLLPPSRVSFACRAAKNSDENQNPFAALQSMRSHLANKPELAVKKEEKRTSTNIDEFAYEDENNTKKELTKKKATPPSPSKNGKGVRIKVERRKNKVVTVVSCLLNPTKELVTKLKKVLGAGASLDADTKACIFQGTHANALEDMIKAMGYKDVKIVK
jgi:translation initiation factor 1 (eIF-1/SUI1)